MKKIETYVVRNPQGQFLGAYRALSAQQAIARLISDDRAVASTFRRSQPATKFVGLSARVETQS